MSTQVMMPQLGESVVEGTISRWLVSEGQAIQQYEPLLQVTTDKVDTEITAPASGVLLKIYVPEGQTVERGTVLAIIGQVGEVVPDMPPAPSPAGHGAEDHDLTPAAAPVQPETAQPAPLEPLVPPHPTSVPAVTPVAQRVAQEHGVDLAQVQGSGPAGRITKEDVEAHLAARSSDSMTGPSAPSAPAQSAPERSLGFISPAVARLAAEHSVDLNRVRGTGEGGRITKKDVQAYVAARQGGATGPAPVAAPAELPPWEQPGTGSLFKPSEDIGAQASAPPAPEPAAPRAPVTPGPSAPLDGDEMQPLSAIRRSIARHMVLSKQTSAHVTTVMEADMTRVVQAREQMRAGIERQGAKLTFTPFFIQAVIAGLRAVPEANSTFQEDHLLLHRHMHIGMAVAIPDGLIVPVIQNADEKSLLGLARAVHDLAERARTRRLNPDEVQGGTFTLTNHGTSGSLLATPIINQPQAGILGVGTIHKRPVVISQGKSLLPGPDDYLAIRPMVYLSFTFDHRILDGAGADGFLSAVKQFLETYTARD